MLVDRGEVALAKFFDDVRLTEGRLELSEEVLGELGLLHVVRVEVATEVGHQLLLLRRELHGLAIIEHLHAVGHVVGEEVDTIVPQRTPLPILLLTNLPILILIKEKTG